MNPESSIFVAGHRGLVGSAIVRRLQAAGFRNLVLRAGTGETGLQLLRRGHRLPVSVASLNGRAVSERKPVLVADTEKSGNFLPNPLLPLTRSELAVPLMIGDKVVGVLDLQSQKAETFNETNLPAFRLLASQLLFIEPGALLAAARGEVRWPHAVFELYWPRASAESFAALP